MQKKFWSTLFLFPVLFSSCQSAGGNPKAVLSKFFELLLKKDIVAARKLATADSKSTVDFIESAINMSQELKETEKFNPKGMEYGETKIDGDIAVIPVKIISTGETISYTLKKVNNEWKVAPDMASVMSLFMEKMYDNGINPADSIYKAMRELKKMDSLEKRTGMQ